jgi:hypothetical protein
MAKIKRAQQVLLFLLFLEIISCSSHMARNSFLEPPVEPAVTQRYIEIFSVCSVEDSLKKAGIPGTSNILINSFSFTQIFQNAICR